MKKQDLEREKKIHSPRFIVSGADGWVCQVGRLSANDDISRSMCANRIGKKEKERVDMTENWGVHSPQESGIAPNLNKYTLRPTTINVYIYKIYLYI